MSLRGDGPVSGFAMTSELSNATKSSGVTAVQALTPRRDRLSCRLVSCYISALLRLPIKYLETSAFSLAQQLPVYTACLCLKRFSPTFPVE
jgi:hypothetical protein